MRKFVSSSRMCALVYCICSGVQRNRGGVFFSPWEESRCSPRIPHNAAATAASLFSQSKQQYKENLGTESPAPLLFLSLGPLAKMNLWFFCIFHLFCDQICDIELLRMYIL